MNNPNQSPDGFTPEQINLMCDHPLEKGCPVQLRTLTKEEIYKIPFMQQVLYLMRELSVKDIPLVAAGTLPPSLIKILYSFGGYDWSIKSIRVLTDDMVPGIKPLRMALDDTGLTQTGFIRLSLSEKGRKLLSEPNELMRTIMLYLLTDYNTGWHDGMISFDCANVERLYSLWLLHHYGEEWLPMEFYADEYFKAFPYLRKDTGSRYFRCEDIYSDRILLEFFMLIGLCESRDIRDPKTKKVTIEVRKTPILDMMFSFEEPAKI